MIGRRLAASTGLALGATAIVFGVAAPPEQCPEIDAAEVSDAADLAVAWIVANQLPDGSFLYEYDRETDTVSDDYNEVRHAGLLSSLYQAAARGHGGALDAGDRGLGWAQDHIVRRHGWAAMTDSDVVSVGTNALLIAALAERRADTGDDGYDTLMHDLARLVADQVQPSGAILAYFDLEPDRARPDVTSIYYTGEAQWALARMHETFPDEGWDVLSDRVLHYMATERDVAEGIWPPLADHWSGYGLATTAAFPDRPAGSPLTDDEVAMVRRQGGLMGQRVRSIAQRFGPWGVAVRGTFTPRGGGYGVFGEGLTGLWRAAQRDDRLAPERAELAQRATCIVGLAIDAQVTADEAAGAADPVKARGAWFIDGVTRMDDQQHALSALLMTVPLLESTPPPFDPGHPSPSWVLWLIVVIAALDPVRAALGAIVDTPDGPRARRLRTMAIAGTIGVIVLVAVGACSGWLLDLVGTSRPAVRLGAGAVVMLSAVVDVWRPRPEPAAADTSTAGRVAVAATRIVRPVLIVGGWSVVADLGLAAWAVALVVAAALALGATAIVDRVPEALTAWLVRLTGAIALAGGALLIANAVFAL